MSTVTPGIQGLARRLLTLEASHDNSTAASIDVAARVVGELRLRLIKLAGVDGFRSLLSRALTLAMAEAPSLNKVRVRPDGSLVGFDKIEEGQEVAEAEEQHGAVIVGHLLELLVTFIGAPLTLRLIQDRWPDASLDDADSRDEVES